MAGMRRERVAEAIKEELSLLLQRELKDPRIGYASVVRVELSRDMRQARVYVSVLGGATRPASAPPQQEREAPDRESTLEALQRARGFLRSEIGRRLQLRHAPEIEFRSDESIAHSVRIAAILNEVLPPAGKRAGGGSKEPEPVEEGGR